MSETPLGAAWREHVENLGIRTLIDPAYPSEDLKKLLDAATLDPLDPNYPDPHPIFRLYARTRQTIVMANFLKTLENCLDRTFEHPVIKCVLDDRTYNLPNGEKVNTTGFVAYAAQLMIEGTAGAHFASEFCQERDPFKEYPLSRAIAYAQQVGAYYSRQGNNGFDADEFSSFVRIAHAERGYLIYDPAFMIVPYKIDDPIGMPHIEDHPEQKDAYGFFRGAEPT